MKEADANGQFQMHPLNYTAKLKKDEKSQDKVGGANSPSPISGDSETVRHLGKDHLTAKRLDAEGTNTRITHRRPEDELVPEKSRQQLQKPGFASASLEHNPD